MLFRYTDSSLLPTGESKFEGPAARILLNLQNLGGNGSDNICNRQDIEHYAFIYLSPKNRQLPCSDNRCEYSDSTSKRYITLRIFRLIVAYVTESYKNARK
jgi:hypothetical protein